MEIVRLILTVLLASLPLAAAVLVVAIMDAYRSRGRLEGICVILPEVVRISKGREGNFTLQIENEKLVVRRIRLGLTFPPEIYAPAVEFRTKMRSVAPPSTSNL